MKNELHNLVMNLAADRLALKALDDEWREAQEAFNQKTADLQARRKLAAETADATTELLRSKAIGVHGETGDKKPHPAISIIEQDIIEIGETAKSWAVEHAMHNLLKLDNSGFKKAVKAGVAPEDTYERRTEFGTRIASDLAKFTAEER